MDSLILQKIQKMKHEINTIKSAIHFSAKMHEVYSSRIDSDISNIDRIV